FLAKSFTHCAYPVMVILLEDIMIKQGILYTILGETCSSILKIFVVRFPLVKPLLCIQSLSCHSLGTLRIRII
ncbi:hypothetical protein HN873_014331, partial [Arachis hypogaea]